MTDYSVDPLIDEHFPQIAALTRQLGALTRETHVIKVKEDKHRDFDDRELAERVAKQLNRKGGPKISSSAIV